MTDEEENEDLDVIAALKVRDDAALQSARKE